MEWFALLCPILLAFLIRWKYPRRVLWWEIALPVAISAVLIALTKFTAERISVRDTEYWGGWTVKAAYFEPWDEEVACSHAKYRTETRTDSKGNTYTEQVFDGYQHPYDVDFHQEYWEVADSNDIVFGIDSGEYDRLCGVFQSKTLVDMNRNYHSIDGDAYVSYWDGNRSTLQPVTSIHSYENRVAKSNSIFSYPEVDLHKQAVVGYPQDEYQCPSVIVRSADIKKAGITQYWDGVEEIDKINALLGASSKVRIWIIIWLGDADRQLGLDQEAYWKGGNKNELVITLNVKSKQDPIVNWCHVFSWSKSEDLKQAVNSYLSIDNTKLDLRSFAPVLEEDIKKMWVKRNWHEFDYLSIPIPLWAMIMIWVLTISTSVGCFAWAIKNEYNES